MINQLFENLKPAFESEQELIEHLRELAYSMPLQANSLDLLILYEMSRLFIRNVTIKPKTLDQEEIQKIHELSGKFGGNLNCLDQE